MGAFGSQETVSGLPHLQTQRLQNRASQRPDVCVFGGRGGGWREQGTRKRQSGYETPCRWSDLVAKSQETLNHFSWKLN